jgi:hypothetical protein
MPMNIVKATRIESINLPNFYKTTINRYLKYHQEIQVSLCLYLY